MTGPASAVVRRVPCPPRTRLGGSSPPQRRLADHVAHEPPVTGDGAITQLPACFLAILKNRRHRQLESVWTTGIKQGWQEVNKNR